MVQRIGVIYEYKCQRPDSPGNPAVKPEVSTELELGFDFAILDDRVSGEFTKYWREDKQSLLELALLPSFGFPGDVDRNLGRIDNWGWEAMLGAQLYTSDAISVPALRFRGQGRETRRENGCA